MAPRDPDTIKRDQQGQFAATDAAGLAAGLAAEHGRRKKAKKPSRLEKNILKTLATGEDHLNADDFPGGEADLAKAIDKLEAAGMVEKTKDGYRVTQAGKDAITPKKKATRRRMPRGG